MRMPAQINRFDQPSIAKTIQVLEHIDQSSFTDDGERNEALLAAYALVSRLETPWETVARLAMAQVNHKYSRQCFKCNLAET